MRDFVHLHNHTEYSLLDGLSQCPALAQYAAELGMPALAITDHGVMYGAVAFYQACKAAGIKPIIGMEAYVAQTHRTSRDREDGKPHHLVLLAQNQVGYGNLLKLASIAQLEGFYYRPRIDKEVLETHGEGLILLSACVQGEIPQLLYQRQEAKAREAVRWYQERFAGRFYIELQSHDIPEHEQTYRQLATLAQEMQVPLVATNDTHYVRREQADAHDVLLCIGTGKTVNEPNRLRMTDASYYMRSPDEMWQLYHELPEALLNTVKIAEQCEVELQFAPPYHLPKFPVPEGGGSSQAYLHYLCKEGMKARYGEDHARPDYVERLEYELSIIHQMGFNDYFLIVWDLSRAAEERDIWWNVRGSGAGSVVAYTLGITSVDPFRNRLMFERFLNPDRISMPDIDLDYPDDRRAELIAYTKDRYGADHVSAIITFGTLGARAAIRDVGRALDVPLGEVDKVARLIPNVPGKPVSISQALDTVPELLDAYQGTPYIKKLLETAKEVEGVTRHASTHAAGIIISDHPLDEYLPLSRPTRAESDDSPVDRVSQWPMEIVDAMGMLKVDFLGLRTLTHMRKACELIEQEHGRKLDLTTIPYERVPEDPELDADVRALYELLSTGETTGVFQVEGAGMRRTLRDMRPEQFQHIIAVLALYRPGPMDNIPTYIKRMHGEEPVEYHHPILADILDDTYGIIVYQEQIMQIAVAMAGYQPGEADMIRKAVAKKVQYLMEKHQRMFTAGAINKGITPEVAARVWGDIEFFARYGFNRAHATDYAVITAQTAYLKAHYPLEFMTALMTTERHNTEKLGFLIADARRTGLQVVAPSINHSSVECTIERDPQGESRIRLGLGAIKNVGDDAMQMVVELRNAKGPFSSMDDLVDRVDLRKLNRKTLECLIQAGAMDEFGERAALMTLIDTLLGMSNQIHSARDVGQFMLFDNMSEMRRTITLPDFVPPIADRQLLEWEKELLGTYLSKHPLADQERDLLDQGLITTLIGAHATEAMGQNLKLVGMIQRVRRITTKKNDMMAFVTLEGSAGTLDAVVFPRTFEKCKDMLIPNRVLVVGGKLDSRQDREDHNLIADWFKEPHEFLLGGPHAPYGAEGSAGQGYVAESDYGYVVPASAPSSHSPAGDGNGHETAGDELAQRPVDPVERSVGAPDVADAGIGESVPVQGGDPEMNLSAKPAEMPPEPPSPPATLYITLKRSGNNNRDFDKLSQLYQVLCTKPGPDRFVVVLEGERKIELTFPRDSTLWTPSLREQIASLVGAENLRVLQIVS